MTFFSVDTHVISPQNVHVYLSDGESNRITLFLQPPPISVTPGVSPRRAGSQFAGPTPVQQLLSSKLTTASSPLQAPSLDVTLSGAPLRVNPFPRQHNVKGSTLLLPKLAVSFV